jgi:hypothetical protein
MTGELPPTSNGRRKTGLFITRHWKKTIGFAIGVAVGFAVPLWQNYYVERPLLSIEIDSIKREIPEDFRIALNDYAELRALSEYNNKFFREERPLLFSQEPGRTETNEDLVKNRKTVLFRRVQILYDAAQDELNSLPEAIHSAESDLQMVKQLILDDSAYDKFDSIFKKLDFDEQYSLPSAYRFYPRRNRKITTPPNRSQLVQTTNVVAGTNAVTAAAEGAPDLILRTNVTLAKLIVPSSAQEIATADPDPELEEMRQQYQKHFEKRVSALKSKQADLHSSLPEAKRKIEELKTKFVREKSLFSITAALVNSGKSTVSIKRPTLLRVYIGSGNYVDLPLTLKSYESSSEVNEHATKVVSFTSDEISNFPKADQDLINNYWQQSVNSILFVEDILGVIHASNAIAFSEGLYQKQIRDRLTAEASRKKYPKGKSN